MDASTEMAAEGLGMIYRSSAINVNFLRQSYLKLRQSARFLNLVICQERQERFLLLQLRSLFHASGVSVTQVNIFHTEAELFFPGDMLPRKCILTFESDETQRPPRF